MGGRSSRSHHTHTVERIYVQPEQLYRVRFYYKGISEEKILKTVQNLLTCFNNEFPELKQKIINEGFALDQFGIYDENDHDISLHQIKEEVSGYIINKEVITQKQLEQHKYNQSKAQDRNQLIKYFNEILKSDLKIFGENLDKDYFEKIFTRDHETEIQQLKNQAQTQIGKDITVFICGGSQMGKDSLIRNLSKDQVEVNQGNGLQSQTSDFDMKTITHGDFKINFINSIGLFDRSSDFDDIKYKSRIFLKLLIFLAKSLEQNQRRNLSFLKMISVALIVQTTDSAYLEKRQKGVLTTHLDPLQGIFIEQIQDALQQFFEPNIIRENTLLVLTQNDLASLHLQDQSNQQRIKQQESFTKEIFSQSKQFVSNLENLNFERQLKTYNIINPERGQEFYSQFATLANKQELISNQQKISNQLLERIVHLHKEEEPIIVLKVFQRVKQHYEKVKNQISEKLISYRETIQKLQELNDRQFYSDQDQQEDTKILPQIEALQKSLSTSNEPNLQVMLFTLQDFIQSLEFINHN